jgi:hypothetical protein
LSMRMISIAGWEMLWFGGAGCNGSPGDLRKFAVAQFLAVHGMRRNIFVESSSHRRAAAAHDDQQCDRCASIQTSHDVT